MKKTIELNKNDAGKKNKYFSFNVDLNFFCVSDSWEALTEFCPGNQVRQTYIKYSLLNLRFGVRQLGAEKGGRNRYKGDKKAANAK